ncbi:protein tipE [Daktulosphaira vitifoliae]|uniref:protein tipE n=1 Tax=Daktulosphaira vitifoliae TaxID=58002 RepID=UPI0021AAACEE|nr:protein tipE [Daktulosphaira vitifoliae]
MRSASSELLLDTKQQQLRKKKLLELAAAKKQKRCKQRTIREKLWFYSTLSFAMIAVGSGSALLFLVPLYVDPAVSTLLADFVTEPVQCTTVRREELTGLYNCTWSSCREGCTSDVYRCNHIYVTYREEENGKMIPEAVLLVNIKGCGYPPAVSCTNFTGAYSRPGSTFPCHYSRQNHTLVVSDYDQRQQYADIVNYFAVPFTVCVVTSVILCVMHCDCQEITSAGAGQVDASRSFTGQSQIEGYSDHSISTRVERLDEAILEASKTLGEPSGL